MNKFNRASKVDGELRERLGCRRSRRISPLVLPVRSEIDAVRAPLLSPVVEASFPDEELTAESCIGVDLKLAPSPLPGVAVHHDSSCPVAVSKKPELMEMLGGMGSQGEAAMALDSGSGSLLTDDSPLSPIGMVSSSPSPLLDERRNLAAAIVDIPMSVADSIVMVEDSHVVEVVDRPGEVLECQVEETERPVEVVDSLLVAADSPVEVIAGRPVVMKCKDKSVRRVHRYLMKKVNQVKVEDGEFLARLGCRRSSRISHPNPCPISDLDAGRVRGSPVVDEIDDPVEVSADGPGQCVDSDPRSAANLDLRLTHPPILEEEGMVGGNIQNIDLSIEEERGSNECRVQSSESSLDGGEIQISDGEGRPMNGFGQASSDPPELPCQVTSAPLPLLPVDFSNVSLEKMGEGNFSSMQGPLLHRIPEVEAVGLSTIDQGRQFAQMQQVQKLDDDFKVGDPIKAVTGLGNFQLEAAHDVPAVPLAHGASVGSGDR
ncbi:hypothetical protein Dimus_013537, partial [Dionaea muscipula]